MLKKGRIDDERFLFISAVYEVWVEKYSQKKFLEMLIDACPHEDLIKISDNKLLDNLLTK